MSRLIGVLPDRRSLGDPIPGGFSCLEELDLVAGVLADEFKELIRLEPVSYPGQHHRNPGVPGRAEFGGVARQPIQSGQRHFGHGVRIIDQDTTGLVVLQQAEGFGGLCAGVLVVYFARAVTTTARLSGAYSTVQGILKLYLTPAAAKLHSQGKSG